MIIQALQVSVSQRPFELYLMQNPAFRVNPVSWPLWLLVRVNTLQMWRRFQSVRSQSPLLTGIIAVFVIGYLILSFWLFFEGLRFVAAFPGLGMVLTERLLYVLFACLFTLLLLSNLVIGYTNFFRNREATYLLTTPVPREVIFRWKFIEATLLASWAFLFLIAPLLVAFGLTRGVQWHFYIVAPILIGMFIVLPGVAGAWMAIHLARYLDRRSFQITVVTGSLLLLIGAGCWWKAHPSTGEVLETRVLEMLDQLLIQTRFAQFPFLPSYWLTASVIQWTEGILNGAGFFILVLLSNVLFFGFLAFTRMGNLFYEASSVVQGRTGSRVQWDLFQAESESTRPTGRGPSLPERLLGVFKWVDPALRVLVIKDARTFWRDTAQWGQSVMLFGLLGVYIINLRHFTQQLTSLFWINMVSFLNLGACSLNLATVTTRFVFPQFSLEGKRLWVVGMAPMGLAKIVKAKYWLASLSSLVVTLSLIMLSSYLLDMTWDRVAFFSAAVTIMTFSLNGLAVGLGVVFPNFRDASPSKIVSGFGGTLCLVLSFLYILASVLILGFGTSGLPPHTGWAVASVVTFTFLSFLIGWVPLKLGLKRLDKLEI